MTLHNTALWGLVNTQSKGGYSQGKKVGIINKLP